MRTNQPTTHIPFIIHQIWYQGKQHLPAKYLKWHHSVVACNPNFTHQLWSEKQILTLLNEHYPQFVDTFTQLPHMHLKIDMIKTLILHHVGGIYIDMDCIALNNFDRILTTPQQPSHYEIFNPQSNIIMQRMFCLPGASDYAFLNNNFIASIPKHPFLIDVVKSGIDYYNQLPKRYLKEKYYRRIIMEAFGPRRLTHCYHQYSQQHQDINILNSGTFELSEFEQRVGKFYGIPGIHNAPVTQHCISHQYEVTWMPQLLQKRFKKGYQALPQLLEYYYYPKNHWEKIKGIPWGMMQKTMSYIKWNRNLIGERFSLLADKTQIEKQYHFYSKQSPSLMKSEPPPRTQSHD